MKSLKDFSFKKLFSHKKFSAVFSVVVAFCVWIVITVQQKPVIQRTFTEIPVSINLENTFVSENNMSIIGDISSQKFTIVVTGPTSVVSALTAEDIGIYASAGEVDAPGTYSLKVSPTSTTAAAEFDINSIYPPTIDVNFDYVDTEEFTINAIAEGVTAANGLVAEGGMLGGTESDIVTVTGPRAVVGQIETVAAVAKVNKTLSSTETFDAQMVLLDANGKELSQEHVSLSVSNVQVTVPISKKKTVPVVATFSNAPSGFSAATIPVTYNFGTVTIIGVPDNVDKTTQISLSAIDITTLSNKPQSFDLSLKMPEGIRILDSIDQITATIDTSGYAEKSLNVTQVKYTGLSKTMSTASLTTIKNVKICGPARVIRNITANNITAEVDLTDKKAGQHTVNVKFKLNDCNNVWVVGTYTTTVTIK